MCQVRAMPRVPSYAGSVHRGSVVSVQTSDVQRSSFQLAVIVTLNATLPVWNIETCCVALTLGGIHNVLERVLRLTWKHLEPMT